MIKKWCKCTPQKFYLLVIATTLKDKCYLDSFQYHFSTTKLFLWKTVKRNLQIHLQCTFCFLSVDEIHSHPDVFLDGGPAPGGAIFSSCVDEAEKAMKQEVDVDSEPSGCRENKLSLTIANSECVGRCTLLINRNPSTPTQNCCVFSCQAYTDI